MTRLRRVGDDSSRLAADLAAINAIYNEAVRTSTSTLALEERSEEELQDWWERHRRQGSLRPVWVAMDESAGGAVVGWASVSDYSDRCGYIRTGESSIYLAAGARGAGLGRRLYAAALDDARAGGVWTVIARITADNPASLALHERLGFREVGRLTGVGLKFDRRLDVAIFQISWA